ncbi:MAG: class II aldolase/adducin family protein [Spirochaetes bacterium]|nr:class II aldolase/adducin family protein [Spirochaetota bacterium]
MNTEKNTAEEGVLKYIQEHSHAADVAGANVPGWTELNDARNRLFALGLVGVTPAGIGYGNLSVRTEAGQFIISGTGTGARPVLGAGDYCLVSSFDIEKNRVVSAGPVQASSEAMTHGAVYRAGANINCVIHVHSRAIFDGMKRDSYAATPQSAAYGTPEIALAIAGCIRGSASGEIVLLGHDEGVITYGETVEKALGLIIELNAKYCL